MVELEQKIDGVPVIVIVGTKEQCTESLHIYPNFISAENVGFGIWKYLYQAKPKEKVYFVTTGNAN